MRKYKYYIEPNHGGARWLRRSYGQKHHYFHYGAKWYKTTHCGATIPTCHPVPDTFALLKGTL